MSATTTIPAAPAPVTDAQIADLLAKLQASYEAKIGAIAQERDAMCAVADARAVAVQVDASKQIEALVAEHQAWKDQANATIDALTRRAMRAEQTLAAPAMPAPADPLADPAVRAALLALAQQQIAQASTTTPAATPAATTDTSK